MTKKIVLCLLLVFAAAIFVCGCDNKISQSAVPDKPLAVFQKELLHIAFEAATAIPVKPHIKCRSKIQQTVVESCLELGQHRQAFAYTKKIDNWRRGLCYAELASYCATQNYNKQAQYYLELAGQIAKQDHGQYWRSQNINMKITQAQRKLKQAGQTKISESKENFEQQIRIAAGLIQTNNFDDLKSAIGICTQLFNHFYKDPNRQSLVEEKIKISLGELPVFIRVNLLLDIAGIALENSDRCKAIELINEAQVLLDDYQWRLKQRIIFIAKLSKLRFQAGDVEIAQADTDAALALFNAQRDSIENIHITEVLHSIAHTYQSMGDTKAAISVYKLAVEEIVKDASVKLCAENLSATCCSMAICAVEPDAELWMRIHQISSGLAQR